MSKFDWLIKPGPLLLLDFAGATATALFTGLLLAVAYIEVTTLAFWAKLCLHADLNFDIYNAILG